jgi:hypothetical protein
MSTFHHHLQPSYVNELEYSLDFDKNPEKNLHGLQVLCANNIKCNIDLIDKVAIDKPLFDPRDCMALMAMLDEDGASMAYVASSSPMYFLKEAKEMHQEKVVSMCQNNRHSPSHGSLHPVKERASPPACGCASNFLMGSLARHLLMASKERKPGTCFACSLSRLERMMKKITLSGMPLVSWLFTVNSREAHHLGERQESKNLDNDFLQATKHMLTMNMQDQADD